MCCKWNIYRSTIVPKKLSSPEKFVVALMNNNKKICFSFFFWKICACQVFPLCVVNEIFIVIPLFQKSSPAQKNLWLRSWTITRKFASVFFFLKNFYLSGLPFMCCKWNIYRSTLIPKKLPCPEKFVVALMNYNKKNICFSFFGMLTFGILEHFMACNGVLTKLPPPTKKRLEPPAFEFLIFPSPSVLEPFNSL